ncbi:antiviral innate immune response receptor RIG-I-like isoform X2 [Ostrea edulis]|uniref:antiviral innate immune response receptor RIG-I-like isoform X2 n=1 Tax=Ostrea edulis TaxID=37623 RepID=UPI0024AFB90E|nr:antiviral innate immune response receptor RIG-I-like isoform X2 [Ostrea edulis]
MQSNSKMDEEHTGQNLPVHSPMANAILLYDRNDEDVQNHFIEDQIENLSLEPDQIPSLEPKTWKDSVHVASGTILRNASAQPSKYAYSESKAYEDKDTVEWKPFRYGVSKTESRTDVPKKKLVLREYQHEQAEKPLRGENCIIVSPTGSGKTCVAIRIIQDHLERKRKMKKMVFVVDKNNLANQQAEKIEEYLQCSVKVISGDIQREEECVQDMASLLPHYDVFVITAQMLVNALTKQNVNMKFFSLLIFDECHHCCGSHPFQQVMNHYMDIKLEGDESQLPQIIGFTASLGLAKVNTLEKATENVMTTMANMDADYLVTVQRNKSDLAKHVNNPNQFITNVPVRKKNEFGTLIKIIMTRTEKYLELNRVGMVGIGIIRPPATRGNGQYTQWLENGLLKALATFSDSDATRSLYTIKNYLEIYNNALVLLQHARAIDALNYIKDEIQKHPKTSNYTGIEQKIKLLLEGMTRYEQMDALELFREGQFKIIVATTIAEEGLDVKECNLVVRYDYAGTPIALVQARGRGRAENSRFYILASEDKCVAEKELINTLKEPMMEEAMKRVQQKVDHNNSTFCVQKRRLQELAKRDRDLAILNQSTTRIIKTGQYYLRCLKCNTFLCMSNEIRRILNCHHTCISQDLKQRINCTKFENAAYPGEDIEMGVGQIDCKGKGCAVKLGSIALYQGIFFPILSIKALKIEKDMYQRDTLKKWNMVEKYFTVQDLSTDDIENIVKCGRLIEFC